MASSKASTSALRLASSAAASASSALRISSGATISAKRLPLSRQQSTTTSIPSEKAAEGSVSHNAPFAGLDSLPVYSDEARALRKKQEEQEERRVWRESLEHLNTLGSTQNRNTVWRPAHARNRPVSDRAVTISHLLAANAQVGHAMKATARAFQPWIYGTRQGVAQIDVENATLPRLRKAAKVVREVVLRDGVVLFVGTTRETQRAVVQASRRLGGNGFHVTTQRWMPGCLTNASTLLQRAIITSKEDYIEQWKEEQRLRGEDEKAEPVPDTTVWAHKILQPDLVVVLNTKENFYAAREATLVNIPTIGIIDSDVDPRLVTYPIPANDESVRTQELIVGVLSKAGEDGFRQRRRLLAAKEKAEDNARSKAKVEAA